MMNKWLWALALVPGALGHSLGFTKDPNAEILDACGATYRAVENTNAKVRPLIKELVKTDYFRYYKVDLDPDNCPFVDDSLGMCGNRACAVDPVEDESELPEFWRSQFLGKLANDSYYEDREHIDQNDLSDSCVQEGYVSSLDNRNYCYPEDESTNGPGMYVSLVDNPERFTGYAGAHANKVWRAVYQENCFGYYGDGDKMDNEYGADEDNGMSFARHHAQSPAEVELERVLMAHGEYEMREVGGEAGQEAMNSVDVCAEQRLFYRLLSGMHASVSTHLCTEYLNKSTGEWGPNIKCFMDRVGKYPERVSNLYFNYALVARAVAKLRNYMDGLQFCREDATSDSSTRLQLDELTKSASQYNGHKMFNETLVFATPEAIALKEEFRKRVRNVNALMSCVGCDRCRLWGKLQTAGYGTALKILFELPDHPEKDPESCKSIINGFQRSELVALVNTFDRLSKSIAALTMYRDQLEGASPKTTEDEEPKKASEWDEEWALAWEGLKFILRSYIEFPQNMWRLCVYYADHYWNKFLGRDESLRYHYVFKTDL